MVRNGNRRKTAAIRSAERTQAVCIGLEPGPHLGRTQIIDRKNGNSLGAAGKSQVHVLDQFIHHLLLRTAAEIHAQTAIQLRLRIFVPDILDSTIIREARIKRIEIGVDHRENDVQVPFAPILAHHARSHLRGRERRSAHLLAIGMDRLGEQVGHFGDLVAAELAPLHVHGRIFLLTRIIPVLRLELLDHGRMVAEVPLRILPVLDHAVIRPEGRRQDHVHKAVVVQRDAVQPVHFAIGLDLIIQVLPHLGQRRAQELVIVHISRRIGQAPAQPVDTQPLGMFGQDLCPVVLEIHGPQPGEHLDPMGFSYRNSHAVIVRGRGIQHHAVDTGLVHHRTDGVEIHPGPVIQPGPEHRFGMVLRSTGGQADKGGHSRQQQSFFHIAFFFFHRGLIT